MSQSIVGVRKNPRQARATSTIEAILEAASQVLEKRGEGGVSTTSVAKRAGVSVGTVYQYFPNRDAILLELARRDNQAIAGLIASVGTGDEALRGFVRALIAIYRRRVGAQRQFALMAEVGFDQPGFGPAPRFPDLIAKLGAERGWSGDPATHHARAVVLARAVAGVLRAAALRDADLMQRPEFEKALVGLIGSHFRESPPARA